MPGFVGTQLSITNLAGNYNSRLTYGSLNRPATSAIMALALVQFEWTDWMLSKFPSLYIVSTNSECTKDWWWCKHKSVNSYFYREVVCLKH